MCSYRFFINILDATSPFLHYPGPMEAIMKRIGIAVGMMLIASSVAAQDSTLPILFSQYLRCDMAQEA